jgi:glycerol-3-phosphate dehydrogenase subunit C
MPRDGNEFETTIRRVLDACADCDTCRPLMDQSCLLFPELYRLYDQEKAHGRVANQDELHRLSELCTLCGLCPCADIRTDVIRSKAAWVRAYGMPLPARLLADVQRFGRLGALAPGVLNRFLSLVPVRRAVQKVAGIHPQRRLPRLPGENFFEWARRKGLDQAPGQGPKIAYFAGCTAGYLFPEVARAAVAIMVRNGIAVFVPPQQCCGMPTLLEGDDETTFRRVRANLQTLLETVQEGFEIVCSCPTCGYLMKVLLRERAFYAEAYQQAVGAGSDEIKVPNASAQGDGFARLKKSIYRKILTDDGYFAALDPLKRIALTEKVFDLGEYLERLDRQKRLNTDFGKLKGRMVYYAPCHQREQGIGSPYEALLSRIPGLAVARVGGEMDCCGMGGSLGYKESFHEKTIALGRPLMEKIQAAAPEAIVTDCLSCRLQFQHLLPYPVHHPLEILARACEAAKSHG